MVKKSNIIFIFIPLPNKYSYINLWLKIKKIIRSDHEYGKSYNSG